ncbi:selenium-dependent xanthine dehydrogenase [Desulfonatronum thiosulfatophilum]|uniref:Selenium-dependent xanthine dehydrogenase n=1 Tax=Desulfonatronum thiosulfatophilum TaxID=617002 RepID=A0A1G6ALW2_9BACT|nr:selenium-dependent xanthine dehydrogenase [Desulfonatronum thiosulfatophilum]SDB09350.1 selenium-dependent xanthine dehydrogenase [Desulfonatronum thiosulfatophilum]
MNFTLNNTPTTYDGDPERSVLTWLREDRRLTAAKDGCSGQAACGACLVEIDGKPVLACSTPMRKLAGKRVLTLEGFPEDLRRTLGRAFAEKGAVQCGFCTPGFLTRTKLLLEQNADPAPEEVIKAVRPHLCRCTGYVKIVDAILEAARMLRGEESVSFHSGPPRLGSSVIRYGAYERAVGSHVFTDDMHLPGMLHGALHFSAHPRARVLRIDIGKAMASPGVKRIITAADVPGERFVGMIVPDWPMYVAEGETTRTVADVLACVVAETMEQARTAAALIEVSYEVLEPLIDPEQSEASDILVHESGNLLAVKSIRRGGDVEQALHRSTFVLTETFTTAPIEHGFLEPECSVARPDPETGGVHFHTQGQGLYHDRDDVARVLGLPKEQVRATMVDSGGAFGGKEDLTVQHHAALAAWLLRAPVKVKLSRPESLRMHPKRHPMRLAYTAGCDAQGWLTALKARIVGDTGAYASVGAAVMARAATHAAGAYHVPVVDVESRAVFTNNIPNGAMRGFGVNQAVFAMEAMVERLCKAGGFDPWQFRHDNALDQGRMVTTGQVLGRGIGLRACLEALREPWERVRKSGRAGLSCGIKNCGIGNGLVEECVALVEIHEGGRLVLHHGWSEMGQGIHTVAAQFLAHELHIDDLTRIQVDSDTRYGAVAGATTASRGTYQLGRAVLDAATKIKADLQQGGSLETLAGRTYEGRYLCTDTAPGGEPGTFRSHVAYSFAAHLVLLDKDGKVQEVVAAHDAGTVVNRQMLEGQIEGGVLMGMGAALSERLRLEKGHLASDKFRDVGLLRADAMPKITVIAVDNADPEGPLGAKGVGEIGSIPTAPAIAAAYYRFDGLPRRTLPLEPPVAPVQDVQSPEGDTSWSCY